MTAREGRGADRGEQADGTGPPGAVALVLGGRPITPADVPGLCARVREAVEGEDAAVLLCDVGAVTEPDVATVEALARLQLTAQRLGSRLRVCNASGELRRLLAVTGFTDVLSLCPGHRRAGPDVRVRADPRPRDRTCRPRPEGSVRPDESGG